MNCKFFPSCGGCSYLDLNTDSYRAIKQENLQKSIAILGKIDIEYFWIKPNSRRKITLQIDGQNKVGFFKKNSKELIEIDSCYVSEDKVSQMIVPLKNFVKKFEQKLILKIQVTLFDNILEVIFFLKKEPTFMQSQKITQFAQDNKINASCIINNETTPFFILQNNQIHTENNLKLDLDSKQVFIQATKDGLQKISQIINDFIALKMPQKIIDIYAGFGVYSFCASHLAKEFYAFEGDEEMCKLITKNAAKNSLQNKIFAKNRDLFFHPISHKELNDFDFAIINPPRNGATPQMKEIINSSLKNLVYVSCNPKTFAFDAKILIENGFKITKIISLDQFFGNSHLELVALIER